jgi:hypothetical protein
MASTMYAIAILCMRSQKTGVCGHTAITRMKNGEALTVNETSYQ